MRRQFGRNVKLLSTIIFLRRDLILITSINITLKEEDFDGNTIFIYTSVSY